MRKADAHCMSWVMLVHNAAGAGNGIFGLGAGVRAYSASCAKASRRTCCRFADQPVVDLADAIGCRDGQGVCMWYCTQEVQRQRSLINKSAEHDEICGSQRQHCAIGASCQADCVGES